MLPFRTKLSWLVLALVGNLAFPSWAQDSNWQKEWNQLLTLARKEGRVVVSGPPITAARKELPAKFKERFGISLEYIGGGSSNLAARLKLERQAGMSSIDVFLGGATTPATVLYPEKMIDPVRPVLLLPEVVDAAKWKAGRLWFMEPEDKYILRLFSTVREIMHINTGSVKASDFKSIKDLLNPAWRGKISVASPSDAGTGSNTAVQFYLRLGEPFVKQLYVDQKPLVSRDGRQMADLLARGIYPVSLGAREEDVNRMKEEGLPVATIFRLADWPGIVTSGSGQVVLVKNAPNPNAARVFINWIASKEGLEIYARANRAATTRNDIDEASFLPQETIPVPGANYLDSNSWEFTVTKRDEIKARITEITR
jgi:iron(III) transport system substrate-binding protein